MKNREKKKQNPRDSAGQLLNRGPVSLKRKSVFALSSILFFNSVAPLLSAQTKHEKEMFIKYKPQTESVNDMGDGVMKPVEEKVKALTPVQEVKTKVKDVETQWKSVYDYYYNIFGYTQTAAHLRDLEILEKQCPKLLENKEYKWFKEKIFGSDKPLEELRTKGKFGGVIRKIQEIGNDRNKELDTSSDIIIKTLVEKKESLEKQKEKQEKKFEKGKISKTDYEDFVKKVNDNITEIDKFLQNIKTNSSDTIKTSKNELKYAGLAAIANYTELLRTVGLAIAGGQTYKVEQAQKAFKNEEVINVHSMIGNSFLENMKDINQKSADTTLRTSGVSKDNINKIREIIEKDLNEQTITITKLSKGADKKIISAIENWLDSRGIISKITSSGTLENLEIKIEKVKTVPAIRRFLFSNLKETEFWRMAEAYKNVLKDDKLLKFFLSQKVEWAKPETNKEFMESDLYKKQALILTEKQFQQGKARFTVDEYIDIIVGVIHNNEIILRRNSVDCVGVDPEINSSLSKKLKGYEEAKKLISWQMAALLKDCKDYTPAYLLVAQIGTHAYRLLYQAVGKAGLGVPYIEDIAMAEHFQEPIIASLEYVYKRANELLGKYPISHEKISSPYFNPKNAVGIGINLLKGTGKEIGIKQLSNEEKQEYISNVMAGIFLSGFVTKRVNIPMPDYISDLKFVNNGKLIDYTMEAKTAREIINKIKIEAPYQVLGNTIKADIEVKYGKNLGPNSEGTAEGLLPYDAKFGELKWSLTRSDLTRSFYNYDPKEEKLIPGRDLEIIKKVKPTDVSFSYGTVANLPYKPDFKTVTEILNNNLTIKEVPCVMEYTWDGSKIKDSKIGKEERLKEIPVYKEILSPTSIDPKSVHIEYDDKKQEVTTVYNPEFDNKKWSKLLDTERKDIINKLSLNTSNLFGKMRFDDIRSSTYPNSDQFKMTRRVALPGAYDVQSFNFWIVDTREKGLREYMNSNKITTGVEIPGRVSSTFTMDIPPMINEGKVNKFDTSLIPQRTWQIYNVNPNDAINLADERNWITSQEGIKDAYNKGETVEWRLKENDKKWSDLFGTNWPAAKEQIKGEEVNYKEIIKLINTNFNIYSLGVYKNLGLIGAGIKYDVDASCEVNGEKTLFSELNRSQMAGFKVGLGTKKYGQSVEISYMFGLEDVKEVNFSKGFIKVGSPFEKALFNIPLFEKREYTKIIPASLWDALLTTDISYYFAPEKGSTPKHSILRINTKFARLSAYKNLDLFGEDIPTRFSIGNDFAGERVKVDDEGYSILGTGKQSYWRFSAPLSVGLDTLFGSFRVGFESLNFSEKLGIEKKPKTEVSWVSPSGDCRVTVSQVRTPEGVNRSGYFDVTLDAVKKLPGSVVKGTSWIYTEIFRPIMRRPLRIVGFYNPALNWMNKVKQEELEKMKTGKISEFTFSIETIIPKEGYEKTSPPSRAATFEEYEANIKETFPGCEVSKAFPKRKAEKEYYNIYEYLYTVKRPKKISFDEGINNVKLYNMEQTAGLIEKVISGEIKKGGLINKDEKGWYIQYKTKDGALKGLNNIKLSFTGKEPEFDEKPEFWIEEKGLKFFVDGNRIYTVK